MSKDNTGGPEDAHLHWHDEITKEAGELADADTIRQHRWNAAVLDDFNRALQGRKENHYD